MSPKQVNERCERLLEKIETVGKTPAYIKGTTLNYKLEYERLRTLFLDECINAFKNGYRFSDKF